MKKIGVLIIFTLFLISFINAQPPFETSITSSDKGLEIFFPQLTNVKENSEFNFYLHVSNISNGVQLNNTLVNCSLHLYDIDGNHTLENDLVKYNVFDHRIYITSANFSTIGKHSFFVDCIEQSGTLGGQVLGTFDVTHTGITLSSADAIYNFILFLIIIFLFIIILLGIQKLPKENAREENGKIIQISYLKYFRTILWFVEWLLIVSIFFISSNISIAYLPDDLFGNFLFVLFEICFSLTLPIIVVWFIVILAQINDDNRIKDLWNRGMMAK